ATAAPPAGVIPDQYVVVLADGVDGPGAADEHARRFGVVPDHVYSAALHGYSAHMSAAAAERVSRDPRVRFVEPDRVRTATAPTVPTGIDRIDAEQSPTAAIDGRDTRVDVDVAVIDTGVDLKHPDLNVYRSGAKSCVAGSAHAGNA